MKDARQEEAVARRSPGRRTLHMIGNAHLDPVWLWRWTEGLQAIRATFRSALDRMKETPGFVFTSSQAAVYEWIERTEPAMFEEIKQRVQEGRWIIVGGWWVQPDCNIPGGEGFVRQSLYGQRYFREKFGVTARVGYNVDSFGHNAMLPQILKKSGMDYYVFMRPNPKEKPDLPGRLFQWESPDGTRVLTYQIPYAYNSTGGPKLREKLEQTAAEFTDALPVLMCFYGVGNHGGGPTKENIQVVLEAAREGEEDPSKPVVLFSHPEAYFEDVLARGLEPPVVKDDLQHHASGCYAVHSEIKRNNRRAELALVDAEKLAVAAREWAGFPYPGQELVRAWKDVLFNHFHDILAGTSIREAYVDARNLHGRALAVADETQAFALQAIAAQVDLEGEGTPLVVFNPFGSRRVGPVETEFEWTGGTDIAVTDLEGREVPCQSTAFSAVVMGGRKRLLFVADVPAMGYAVYWLHHRPSAAAAADCALQVTPHTLANEHLQLDFDPGTGGIARITLRDGERQVLAGPGAVGVVIDDPSDTWSHGVFRFDREVGRFGRPVFEVVEEGPVRATLKVTSRYGGSRLIQEFSLVAGARHVDVRVTVDWHEQRKMLKLEFPVAVSEPQPTYEIPFGVIRRPANGEEEPAQHWVDVTGTAAGGETVGLAVATDSKYSYDVTGSTLRLTVLRSPVYAHHDPKQLEEGKDYHFIDQGRQEFRYRIVPHRGGWQEADLPRHGWELNVPWHAVVESNHPGTLPRRHSLLEVRGEGLVLTALKRAEDGDGTIARVYESLGRRVRASFVWRGQRRWEAEFGPFEIKSFRIPDDGTAPVAETDLIER